MSDARRPKPAEHTAPIPRLEDVFGEVPPPAPPRDASPRHPALVPGLIATAAVAGLVTPSSPQCGETRLDELRAHGPQASRALSRGDAIGAAVDIAIAMGWVSHTTRISSGRSGAAMVLGPDRPPPEALAPLPLPPTVQPLRHDDLRGGGVTVPVRPAPVVRPSHPAEPRVLAPGRRAAVSPRRDRGF